MKVPLPLFFPYQICQAITGITSETVLTSLAIELANADKKSRSEEILNEVLILVKNSASIKEHVEKLSAIGLKLIQMSDSRADILFKEVQQIIQEHQGSSVNEGVITNLAKAGQIEMTFTALDLIDYEWSRNRILDKIAAPVFMEFTKRKEIKHALLTTTIIKLTEVLDCLAKSFEELESIGDGLTIGMSMELIRIFGWHQPFWADLYEDLVSDSVA